MKSKRTSQPPCAPPRRRILVVDDHPLMREGIAKWIGREADLEVCGQAGTAGAALALAAKLKPDLVLMDISMPGRGGIDLIRNLHARHPHLPVLVLSMHDETVYAGRSLRAGARGYLMKGVGGGHVVKGIRGVLNGRIAVSQKMKSRLLEDLSSPGGRPDRPDSPRLSDREFEVLHLLGEACSNREIAERLHLSPKTIESHRLRMMQKLKLATSAELLRYAILSRNAETSVRPGA